MITFVELTYVSMLYLDINKIELERKIFYSSRFSVLTILYIIFRVLPIVFVADEECCGEQAKFSKKNQAVLSTDCPSGFICIFRFGFTSTVSGDSFHGMNVCEP